ncbi:MAG: hypothetical protein ACJ789_08025 [Thermomicrobiales bacterium]
MGFVPLTEFERQVEALTYVRFLIHDGRADLALAIIESIIRQSEAVERHGELVELSILAILGHMARHESEKTVKKHMNAILHK